jgi:hypothetical protein
MSGNTAILAGPTAAQITWVERVLGVAMLDGDRGREQESEEAPPDFDTTPDQPPPETGMEQWAKARGRAIALLSALEAAFRDSGDPLSDRGIVLIRAIRANLTERPETPQQLIELVKYIADDDVITEAEVPNGFGITVELRKPLLTALASVRSDMKAAR